MSSNESGYLALNSRNCLRPGEIFFPEADFLDVPPPLFAVVLEVELEVADIVARF